MNHANRLLRAARSLLRDEGEGPVTVCDASASGAEQAVFFVYTRHGKLLLCRHHYRLHKRRFLARGYLTVPVRITRAQFPSLHWLGLRIRLARLGDAIGLTRSRHRVQAR